MNIRSTADTQEKEMSMHLTMEEKHLIHIQSLQEKLSRANRELAVLYEISNAMRTTLDLNHILYIILTCVTAHTGLGFNRAVLFLVNHKERCLDPRPVWAVTQVRMPRKSGNIFPSQN